MIFLQELNNFLFFDFSGVNRPQRIRWWYAFFVNIDIYSRKRVLLLAYADTKFDITSLPERFSLTIFPSHIIPIRLGRFRVEFTPKSDVLRQLYSVPFHSIPELLHHPGSIYRIWNIKIVAFILLKQLFLLHLSYCLLWYSFLKFSVWWL